MSLSNGQIVSKETWDSHNKMMLDPLSVSDSEVCLIYTRVSGDCSDDSVIVIFLYRIGLEKFVLSSEKYSICIRVYLCSGV